MRTLLLAVVLLLGMTTTVTPSERTVGEANVVVAYLYNFGKFIEWPASAFASTDAPMRFCFYGENSLGQVTETLTSKRVSGHPIEVVHIKRGGSLTYCHLLYIDSSEHLYIRPVLNLTRDMPLLTVSEIEGFASAGGVIGLVNIGNKLKFEINSAAAVQAQLRVSSQLLKLAVNVFESLPQ